MHLWFSRVNDLQASLLEQARKRDEAIHALDTMHREKEHAAETERLKLQNRVAEMVEDVSKRILQKDIKLREETQDKFLQIEKVCRVTLTGVARHKRGGL
jgi:hypothetical protein